MATKQVILGKVMLTPRGTYNPEYTYERLDIVTYKGSSWLVLTPFQGVEPTPENQFVMLLAAKGDTGNPFTFDDLTPEQQLALQGAKGEPGKGFVILGVYETLAELEAGELNPQAGDAYGVGETAPYDIYIYDAINECWINNGKLQGPAGRSAYEIAVDAGFEGTEEEWLELLQPDLEVINEKINRLETDTKTFSTVEQLDDIKEAIGNRINTIEEAYATKEEVQEKFGQLGRVFRLRGTVGNEEELENIENPTGGDVIFVKIDTNNDSNSFKGYVYIQEEDKWELIGSTDVGDIYTKEEIDNKMGDYTRISETRDFSTTQNINAGKNITAVGNIYTGGKTSTIDGKPGVTLAGGSIELSDRTPLIDFHFNNSVENYTSRIIEQEAKKLNIEAANGLMLNGLHIPKQNATQALATTTGSVSITTAKFLQMLVDKGIWTDAITSYVKGTWSYATNDFITDTEIENVQLAGAQIEIFKGSNATPVEGGPWMIRITTARSVTDITKSVPNAVFICNRQQAGEVSWIRLAKSTETPQFGTYKTITGENINKGIDLSGNIYDIRYTLGSGFDELLLGAFSNGKDGMEYVLSINNNTSTNCTLKFSANNNYQVDPEGTTSIICKAGRITEVFIKSIFGKYLIRV